jgi:hypothetical protein
MKIISLPSAIALAVAMWAAVGPASAQTCPAGYYYASDGQCYPGAPPSYPPPVYVNAPPVYQPPAVFDGFAIGLGIGALVGAITDDRGGGRGGYDRGGYDRGGRGRR